MPMEPIRDNAEPEEDLESLTKSDLQERAADLGVEGRSQMTKDELIDAVEAGSKQPAPRYRPDSSV